MSEHLQLSLAAARVNKGLTQQQAADKMRVSVSTVSAWERGLSVPTWPHVKKILEVYEADIDSIHFGPKATDTRKQGAQ